MVHVKSLELRLKDSLTINEKMKGSLNANKSIGSQHSTFGLSQSLRILNEKVRKLEDENNRMRYILKEQNQELRQCGIESIWEELGQFQGGKGKIINDSKVDHDKDEMKKLKSSSRN